jgi:hypothetical protein
VCGSKIFESLEKVKITVFSEIEYLKEKDKW